MIQYVTYCTKLFYLQVKLEIGKIGLLLHRMNDLMNYTKKKWRTQNCSLFMSSECRAWDNNNNISLYYEFSLLHIFSLVMQPWMSAYIRKTDGVYIFSPQKRLKHGRQNITLHWINGIIQNNKCIFTKLNAVFILNTAAWTKHITTVNSVTNTWSIQQTPVFYGCTITNKQNFEPWKLSTSWGHTRVLFTCC